MTAPAIKVWNVDYSFLIKNYLDQRLWNHTWTLFEYSDYTITLEMDSINVSKKDIWFIIMIKNRFNGREDKANTYYSLNNDTIDFFIKRLNGNIFRLIINHEERYIRNSDGYETIENLIDSEEDKLTQIATEFLDNENITNKEIREMYIDNYVNENSKAGTYRNNFLESSKYHYLTDLYLVFLQSIKDDKYQQMLLDALNSDEKENVLKQIEEYKIEMQTEEYEEEMKAELEDIF